MNEPRPETDALAQRRLQLKERAKRGLIAGYIHEISGRHGGGTVREAPEAAPGEPSGR
jgi:hypothetical protein